MNDADYVYLTHSHRDKAVADLVATELRHRGVQVWRDDQISAGSSWIDESGKALRASSAVLFLLSRHSKESFSLREALAAVDLGKKLIPIAVDEEGTRNVPPELKSFVFVRLFDDFDRAMNRVLASLNFARQPSKPEVPPLAPKSKGYVFLSYAEDDSDFLDELKPFFKEHGYAYWDYRESDRDYHGPLFLELEGVIQEAKATVSVLSDSWKKSRWVVREFFYSEEIGKPVLLIKAKGSMPFSVERNKLIRARRQR